MLLSYLSCAVSTSCVSIQCECKSRGSVVRPYLPSRLHYRPQGKLPVSGTRSPDIPRNLSKLVNITSQRTPNPFRLIKNIIPRHHSQNTQTYTTHTTAAFDPSGRAKYIFTISAALAAAALFACASNCPSSNILSNRLGSGGNLNILATSSSVKGGSPSAAR